MKRKHDGEISPLGKVFLSIRNLFDRIKEMRLPQRLIAREKKLAGYDESSPRESKIAFIFGVSRIAALSLLCILLAVTLLLGGSIFSFDSVYYMFKDISYISSFSENRPETLSYSRPFTNQDFAIFKNGLSVAGDNEIKFFTSTGRVTLAQGSEFTNPKTCASESSVLIYDQGRNTFKVYNSFVCIYSETLEYPISSAHMSPDGSFCIVTKSEKYGSVVRIYDNKQRLESEFLRNDYILSVSMSSNGKHVAVVSLDSSEGNSLATLTVLERGKSKTKSSVEMLDFLPYSVHFTANDRVALIGSEKAYVYNLNAKQQADFKYPDKLSGFAVSDGGFALLFRDGADSRFILNVFGANGNRVSEHKIEGHVSSIVMSGNFTYLLMDGEVRRIDTLFGTVSTREFSADGAELLVLSTNELLACTDTAAYYISFN